MNTYANAYRNSLEDPESFWKDESIKTAWFTPPKTILTPQFNGTAAWFEDGEINTAFACLDVHVQNGRGDQIALIVDSPVTNVVKKYSYRELLTLVEHFSGVLKAQGLTKGDAVIIYMPMVPEAVIAMLACARLGIIHSVVFGGFAAHELAIRIDDIEAKAIITSDYGIEIQKVIPYHPIVEEAIRLSALKPELVISHNRGAHVVPTSDTFLPFYSLLEAAQPEPAVVLNARDPLYVLYTSGTTGKPKGIVREHGGHAVALRYSMEYIYGVKPGEVFWAASDIGWVVGHSFIVYGPLLHGATTVLFEGKPIKTPDASTFWRVIKEHQVNVFFTAPTAIRAIRKEDPNNEYYHRAATKSLRTLFLAGERCDVATLTYAQELLGIPVIDHWWQTESGWPMLANMQGLEPLPVKPGSSSVPVCGFNIQILREDGTRALPHEQGLVSIQLPLPPGCLPSLWKNEERFVAGYLKRFLGYYFTGDGGYVDEDGYVYITGRVDDVINVAGHRLSTAEMEELASSLTFTAECAVIGINDELKGEVPVAFVVLKDGEERSAKELKGIVKEHIRHEIGAVASLKEVYLVQRLPKTRSGKILRNLLRNVCNGETFKMPGTIEDPLVVQEIQSVLSH